MHHFKFMYNSHIGTFNLLSKNSAMESSLSHSKRKKTPLIETTFKLPADIPVWPPGMNHMMNTSLPFF